MKQERSDFQLTQENFRVLLDSMAHPGRILKLPDDFPAVLYTLLDHEVTFTVIGPGANEEFIHRIYQMTKSTYVGIDEADYVVVKGGSSGGMLAHIRRGELEFPDRGAAVFYEIDELGGKMGGIIELRGPGVKDSIELNVYGIDNSDLSIINQINSEYPLGIDIIFIDRSMNIASIPRSSRISLMRK